jgi:hypothetical protein
MGLPHIQQTLCEEDGIAATIARLSKALVCLERVIELYAYGRSK